MVTVLVLVIWMRYWSTPPWPSIDTAVAFVERDRQPIRDLKTVIAEKMGAAVSGIAVQRANRLWLDVKPESLNELLAFMKGTGYIHIATITGMDFGEQLGAIYHLTDRRMTVSITAKTPRTAPELPTVTGLFPGCEGYERELEDMFGIRINGLPPGRRYPLPDDFPADQHPLRKDWKAGDVYPEEQAAPATEAK